MSSVSSQQQFRYTQTPSKVLHLRNLPWECTEEELIELGKPFGTVVNTKCNVGANKNQAFIEFVSEDWRGRRYYWVEFVFFIESLFLSLFYRKIWTKRYRWFRSTRLRRSLLRFEGKLSTYSTPTGRRLWTTKRRRMLWGMCFLWQSKGRMLAWSALMSCIWLVDQPITFPFVFPWKNFRLFLKTFW